MNENNFLSIGQAAKLLGVAVVTLRRWEKCGILLSKHRTHGQHRKYDFHDVMKIIDKNERINVCYARVSSHDQKEDLERQANVLQQYCLKSNIKSDLIKDLGSGLNFKKKGSNRLIQLIISKRINTIYLTHKDRLLRFGTELIINIAKHFGTKVIIINEIKNTFEEQLVKDVLEIITVFSAELYGSRSNKNKKLAIA